MSVLPMETTTTRFLNVVMLFSVSLEPYLFNLVSLFGHAGETEVVESASLLYALDMAALMVILGFFTHELAKEERQLISVGLLKPYKKIRNLMLITAGLFVLTMVPQFWSWRIQDVPLRFYLWIAPLAVFWVGRTFGGSSGPDRSPTINKS
jgi:hypothetical protein